MNIMEIVFLYVIPTILGIVIGAFIGFWLKLKPSTKTLVKSDFGGKFELMFRADPDNKTAIVPFKFEKGKLVRRFKKKLSEIYLFGVPTPSLANNEQTREDVETEKRILTPYTLHGKPIHFAHSATAVVSNPALLTALSYAENVQKDNSNEIEVDTLINLKEKETENKEKIKVKGLFPFKFDSIAKHFHRNWPDVLIENIELASYTKGAKEQRGMNDTVKFGLIVILVVGIIVSVFIGLMAFAGGLL